MRRLRIVASMVGAIVFAASSLASADIVELDLFDLGCPSVYDFNSEYWTTDFDLGVTLIEISNVYIDWAGEITAGLAIDYRNPGETFPLDIGIHASLGGYPFTRNIIVWGGETTYPAPESFDWRSEIELLGTSSWSDLLDGQGTIMIDYVERILLHGMYVEHGSATLDRASLIVEGVIPEPATVLLLAVGIIRIRLRG